MNHATLTLSEAHTQPGAPYVAPVLPSRIEVMSSPRLTRRDGVFQLRTNGNGLITIERGDTVLLRQKRVRGGDVVALPVKATSMPRDLKVTFTPDNGQRLTQTYPLSLAQVSHPDTLYASAEGLRITMAHVNIRWMWPVPSICWRRAARCGWQRASIRPR